MQQAPPRGWGFGPVALTNLSPTPKPSAILPPLLHTTAGSRRTVRGEQMGSMGSPRLLRGCRPPAGRWFTVPSGISTPPGTQTRPPNGKPRLLEACAQIPSHAAGRCLALYQLNHEARPAARRNLRTNRRPMAGRRSVTSRLRIAKCLSPHKPFPDRPR